MKTLKNESAPYGFYYGYYGVLTAVCKTDMQASSALEGPITDITVFFHMRASKGATLSYIAPPL